MVRRAWVMNYDNNTHMRMLYECKLCGWGYGKKKSDDDVEGGVGVGGWGGAVEEQGEGGEGVENDTV